MHIDEIVSEATILVDDMDHRVGDDDQQLRLLFKALAETVQRHIVNTKAHNTFIGQPIENDGSFT